MLRIIIFIICLFLSAPVYSADFYLDFEDDGGAGTQSDPFNTLAQAQATTSPGDTLYCRGTWSNATQEINEQLLIYGNDAAWLAYGTPNNQATCSGTTSGDAIKITNNADNTILDGFIITGAFRYGILLECASGSEIVNNTITNSGSTAIKPTTATCGDAENILIHDNRIDYTGLEEPDDGYGILAICNVGFSMDGMQIYNNYMSNIGEEAIRIQGDEIDVYNNYIYKWALTSPGDNAIQYHVASYDEHANARIYNNIINGGGTTQGNAIVLWITQTPTPGSLTNLYVYNNTIYGTVEYDATHGFGIVNMGLNPTNWYVYNNIVYECADTAGAGSIGAIRMYWAYEDQVYFYNNIIYNDGITDVITIYNHPSDQYHSVAAAEVVLTNAANNIQVAPGMVDLTPEDDPSDFVLISGSNAIGAGAYWDAGSYTGLDPTSAWPGNVKAVNQDDYGDPDIGAFVYIEAAELGGPGTIAGGGSGSIAGGGSGSIIGMSP